MKRFWIGVGFLAALLGLGIYAGVATAKAEPVAAHLAQAQQCLSRGDEAGAIAEANLAQALWQRNWERTACFADHTPMEQIDTQFAELQTYAAQNAWPDFAATCAGLASQVQSIPRAHQFTWWNLL